MLQQQDKPLIYLLQLTAISASPYFDLLFSPLLSTPELDVDAADDRFESMSSVLPCTFTKVE